MTKFLLDSGDPEEYQKIAQLLREKGTELWGSTTNPSLIAKKLAQDGKKLTREEAFALQKEIILQIVEIVPGAVSGEVYADQTTTAKEMVEQGREIANWHNRVIVKLPTNLEGMKAREILRREGIAINNTLVFSQEQVFAITLQEKLLQQAVGKPHFNWPCFISPFIGRLDDKNENGLEFVAEANLLIRKHFGKDLVWMLEASVRNVYHMKAALTTEIDLITVPAKVYEEWFALTVDEQEAIAVQDHLNKLIDIPVWQPSDEVLHIQTLDALNTAITNKQLNISHPLTEAGIDKFVSDWQAILA